MEYQKTRPYTKRVVVIAQTKLTTAFSENEWFTESVVEQRQAWFPSNCITTFTQCIFFLIYSFDWSSVRNSRSGCFPIVMCCYPPSSLSTFSIINWIWTSHHFPLLSFSWHPLLPFQVKKWLLKSLPVKCFNRCCWYLLCAVFSTLWDLPPLSLAGKHNFHTCPIPAI